MAISSFCHYHCDFISSHFPSQLCMSTGLLAVLWIFQQVPIHPRALPYLFSAWKYPLGITQPVPYFLPCFAQMSPFQMRPLTSTLFIIETHSILCPVTLLWFFSIAYHALTHYTIHLCIITIFISVFHNENLSSIQARTLFCWLGWPKSLKCFLACCRYQVIFVKLVSKCLLNTYFMPGILPNLNSRCGPCTSGVYNLVVSYKRTSRRNTDYYMLFMETGKESI